MNTIKLIGWGFLMILPAVGYSLGILFMMGGIAGPIGGLFLLGWFICLGTYFFTCRI